jgi:hypothetical protein
VQIKTPCARSPERVHCASHFSFSFSFSFFNKEAKKPLALTEQNTPQPKGKAGPNHTFFLNECAQSPSHSKHYRTFSETLVKFNFFNSIFLYTDSFINKPKCETKGMFAPGVRSTLNRSITVAMNLDVASD